MQSQLQTQSQKPLPTYLYSENEKSNKYVNATSSSIFNKDFLITKCESNMNPESEGIDTFYNNESPYKYPSLIISNDDKRNNNNTDIYKTYSDVIYDECGNRYNIRNLRDSAGILQAGYSANIDLDSHLKNINFYSDKCFYDNWKISPKSDLPVCNGLKHSSNILVPDYTAVGKHYKDCIGNGVCATSNVALCNNTPPTDINCETNIRNRYDFTHNSFKKESCIKKEDRINFTHSKEPIPEAYNVNKFLKDSRNYKRENNILHNLPKGELSNSNTTSNYYNFDVDTNTNSMPTRLLPTKPMPAEKLFNNNTSRKAATNINNVNNVSAKYLV